MSSRLDLTAAAAALSLCACSGGATPPAEAPSDSVVSSESAPAVAAPHGKRAPCGSDQACNDDPSVSALWGRCTDLGVCECNDGFERNPVSDLCRPAPFE
jgi:hypothetical protein